MSRIALACAFVLLVALTTAIPASATTSGKAHVIHDSDGNAVRVMLVKTKLLGGSGFFKPKAGQKWVGAYFTIQNLSKHKIDDCGENDAKLTGSNNSQPDNALSDTKPSLDCFNLLPGRTLAGWVVWEMPKRVQPKFIDWTMDSGYADETATWKL